jgi:alpha-glucosidase (family GH31 glycosyl hydrolase)
MLRRPVLGLAAMLACAAPASAATLSSGPITASVAEHPWHLTFTQRGGAGLAEAPLAALAFHTAAGWMHATDVVSTHRDGRSLVLEVATSDPQGRRLEVRLAAAGPGAVSLRAIVAGGADDTDVDATRIGFATPAGERFYGFGERSDAVDQRGHDIENYVSDGPFAPDDRALIAGAIPPQGFRDRDDATYYPVPWLLSSRGYGVLIDRNETSVFHLATDPKDVWSAEVQSHAMALRVFAGPAPAQALRRFTAATDRQPPPVAAWQYGPWFQTGQPNTVPLEVEASYLDKLRKADAPVSAAETQLRYLPCGLDRGNEAYEAARVKFFHDHGLAILTYVNPMLCSSYEPLFDQAAAAGALQTNASGAPATFDAFAGGTGPDGFTIEPVAQFDFTAQGGFDIYGALLRRILAAGHDGWMEDFGEYTPPDARSNAGTSPQVIHNLYPTTYHCGVQSILGHRQVVRLQRSGWTGAAGCAQDVWGGDPTTTFGFDGLSSAVKQALSIGMSGVSRWGSDIGGYDTIGGDPQLTPELLKRWIEFGAVSAVMRTKASGIAIPDYARPQVFDPGIVEVWRRYAKLHTQLYPYLRAADAEYRATGMPLMRALALTERSSPATDDEFGFGPDLLAAPVVREGQSTRSVRLPRGRWLRGLVYRSKDGAWLAHRAALLRGGRTVSVRAGEDELPIFVRAGALLPLLSPDVDTLADGGKGVVRLSDRAGQLRLLAFPRGRSKARIYDREGVRSHLTARAWTLTLSQERTRRIDVQAVLPWRACSATARGRSVAVHGGRDARLQIRIRSGAIRVQRCG